MYDYGIKNCISVPNGANDNDDYWKNSEKYLKNVKKFIIALDNDEKGNELKEKVAQRLGRYRCEFIEWKNKDANGDLISGDIKNSLGSRRKFPVSGTFQVEDMYSDILELYDHGLPDTLSPQNGCFGNLKNVFSVMRGQLTTITGIPSHGKSNYSEWHVLNMVKDYNMKASFFSPEHTPMHLHQTNFIQKAVGRNFWEEIDGVPRITKEDIARYKDWANEKIYLTSPEDGEFPTWEWLFEKFKEQIYSFGIDIFIIDAFNKLELPKGNQLEQINRVLTKLTMFAQMNNVVVFLVAHPTKMKKNDAGIYDCPTLYDVSGSSDFRNQTHNGFGIYRHFENEEINERGHTEFVNLKTKMSFQGEIGKKIEFDYHIPTGRYYARGTSIPTFDMTLGYSDILPKEVIKTAMAINKDFDNEKSELDSLPW
jgi:twinkle protein